MVAGGHAQDIDGVGPRLAKRRGAAWIMIRRMNATLTGSGRPQGLALLLSWSRVRSTLLLSVIWGTLMSFSWTSGPVSVISRTVAIGLIAMLTYGVFEQRPTRLPRWMSRWVLQVVAVAVVIPPTTALIYVLSTPGGAPPFYEVEARMEGFQALCMSGLLFVPWVALGALVRQKEALAHYQAVAFDLERSELERQAIDARLRLVQGQVAPHFLFNTLANVQALVDAGSPQASTILRSLIAYLRAAVPRLNDPATTVGQELDLVQAYLQLMYARMPDRLQFTLHSDVEARTLQCPPLTLLTLVENAVRHGIDPAEDGGRIDVDVRLRGGRCLVRVSDTGVGLQDTGHGLGTGLSTLRERLELAFDGDAQLRVDGEAPRGVVASLSFPARRLHG